MSTLIATNFLGNLTRFPNGALDSGKAVDRTSFGSHAWSAPGIINFTDKQVDITGLIEGAVIDGKPRSESGILYMYVVTHIGNVYKIQVNDPVSKNLSYDNAVLLTTLASATSFTMGGSLLITNTQIIIGHDAGVSSIAFDGSNEQSIGDQTLWQQNVPRQGKIFGRDIYFTNGNTIAKLGANNSVTSYSSISASDDNQIFKTIEIDSTGQFLILVSSNVPTTSLLSTTPNLQATYAAVSYVIKWDPAAEKRISITAAPFEQTAALTRGSNEFIWGYDVVGGGLMDLAADLKKLVSGTGTYLVAQAPTANAVVSSGNLVGWATVEPFPTTAASNVQGASIFVYGNLDQDEPAVIYTRMMSFISSLGGGDIMRVPWIHVVGNLQTAGNTSGYGSGLTQNQTGTGRIYISTVEFDGTNTEFKLYSFSVINPFLNPCAGVYETQAVIAGTCGTTGSTFTPTAYNIYMEPSTGFEEFTIDLIGIDGLPISGGTILFSSLGTGGAIVISPGDVVIPSGAITVDATPVLGIRVTNSGPFTPFIHKIDITY